MRPQSTSSTLGETHHLHDRIITSINIMTITLNPKFFFLIHFKPETFLTHGARGPVKSRHPLGVSLAPLPLQNLSGVQTFLLHLPKSARRLSAVARPSSGPPPNLSGVQTFSPHLHGAEVIRRGLGLNSHILPQRRANFFCFIFRDVHGASAILRV